MEPRRDACCTLSGLVAASAAPASAEPGSFDLINKKDGSRLALLDNNTAAEGAFARGMRVVVKTCKGSDIQKWNLEPETDSGTNSPWPIWRPVVDKSLALTIDTYGNGSWNTLYLDTSYPSSDRLGALRPNDQPWRY
ncbi:hypothetical protein ACIP10_34430 [Streptomyces galbus]|uniref:hypothetical protein n=1 Tax=Streptomyces galbus TaxID=33898 RepID=UPI0037A67FBE